MEENDKTPLSDQEPEPVIEIPAEARNMATLCHLLGLTGFVGPLIIWLLKRNQHYFIDTQGRAALNFQFTIAICYIAAFIFQMLSLRAFGFAAMALLMIANLAFVIVAAMTTRKGMPAIYPLAIRFLV